MLSKEEMDVVAKLYQECEYKLQHQIYNSSYEKRALKSSQAECIQKLYYLVLNKVRRYKKFSNYKDLEHDALEAMLNALKTFNPAKGSFAWWVNKYTDTKVYRSANNHSTIRIPIKKTKEIKPYKVSEFPLLISTLEQSPASLLEKKDILLKTLEFIKNLPEIHQQVLLAELTSNDNVQQLELTKTQFNKILKEAKIKLKQIIPHEYFK